MKMSSVALSVQSVLSVLSAGFMAGCTTPPRPATAEAPPITVVLGRVSTADMPEPFEAGGVVRSQATAVMASRLLAPIADVRVRAGDRVHRGETLVILDSREIKANAARATASLAVSTDAMQAADADVRAAEAGLRLAVATHERIATLASTRSATAQELDQAVAGLSAADAQLNGARFRSAAAVSARDAARAAAEAADFAASYAVVTAPFDGLVTERSIDAGSMAAPGTALLTIEDTSTFHLEVRLDEARGSQLRVGQASEIDTDDEVNIAEKGAGPNGRWIAGRVIEIARVDPASHTFLVKVALPNTPGWQSGRFGRARFAGAPRRTLTAPAAALVRRGQLTFAFVVDAEGHARLRPITAGRTAGGRVEVLAGATDGDSVVVNPSASLSDGARVNPGSGR